MKVMIDIDEEDFRIMQHNVAVDNPLCPLGEKEIVTKIANGTPIPDNATNGDIIKAMFPNAEFNNAMPFTDGRWETMNLDTENRLRAIYRPTQLRTYADWWNAPYKKGTEE